MNTKKTPDGYSILNTYQQSNNFETFSNDVSNWKSVVCIHSKKKEISLDNIQCYLRKYFSNRMSIIKEYYQIKDFIVKQIFEEILRNSGVLIDKNSLESSWNSCQPTEKGISYKIFCERFAPFQLENNQNSKVDILSPNQSRILNYTTRIDYMVKNHWQNLKEEFFTLDRYGRLFITVDQAMNLMKKYCFPLNDKEQCELALLFSPKNNGQFNYFDFMQYFTNQSSLKNLNQRIFSRSTYSIQSKQSWTVLSINIDCILARLRSECINIYENIYRMFQKIDQNHQGYLTKIQFNQLLKQFHIYLNEEEFYHLMSEVDQNQDGVISYDELYFSLITDALQI